MVAPPIRYTEAPDGTSLAYWSAGTGPELLYVPNLAYAHAELVWTLPTWRAWFEALVAHWRVTYFDPRGTGLSDSEVEDYRPGAMLVDVRAVADAAGVERATVFADVSSVPLAVEVAVRDPALVERLVVWHPWSAYSEIEQASAPVAAIDANPEFWGVRNLAPVLVGRDPPPNAIEELDQLMGGALRPHQLDGLMEGLRGHNLVDDLPAIQVPVLALHRRDSPYSPLSVSRDFTKRLRDGQLLVLDGDAVVIPAGDLGSVISVMATFTGTRAQAAASTPFRTLMFTDLAASTATTQRLGDAAAQDLVRAHNEIVRTALAEHHGDEIKHTGDGIMAWFPAASNALDCAQAIQEAVTELANPDVGVKIGLNAGEPIAEDDDLYGTAVQIAARVTDQAQAGEVVVTNVVRELVAGKGYLFSEREPAALKGVEEPVRLFTLGASG